MNYSDINETIEKLKKKLEPKRFLHSLSVAYTASCLAMRYGYDCDKAYLAGLLHDCGKEIKTADQVEFCKSNHIAVSDSEILSPQVLHEKSGAFLAGKLYGCKDNEIISAISCHTTGKSNMSMLDKIIYVADYIEPHRNKQKRLFDIRKAAFEDIDLALYYILSDTIEFLQTFKDKPINPETIETYNYVKRTTNYGNK